MHIARRYPVLVGLFLAQPLSAAVFLVDMNTHTGTYPGGVSAWNTYAAPANITGGVITDTTGSSAAGITLSKTGTWSDADGVGDAFNGTTYPYWVGSPTDVGAIKRTFVTDFFNKTGVSMTLQFSNLHAGGRVILDTFFSGVSSSWGVPKGAFSYSLDQGTTWSGFTVLEANGTAAVTDGWDTHNTLTQYIQGIADGNGKGRFMSSNEITLTGSTLWLRAQDFGNTLDGTTDTLVGINAVRLQTIPEPATVALMGMASLLLHRRRR